MKSSLNFLAALFAPIAFAFCAPDKPATTSKPSPTASPSGDKAKPTPKPGGSTSKEDAILSSFPMGAPVLGIRIPNRDPSGKLLMLFDAASAQRINDRHIEFNGLKMEIHNNDGSTFHVDMKHSVFNLDTRILASDTPTTIRRDDFVINGDRAEFNTKEKFGRVMGHVKMVIFNSGNPK